MNYNLAQVIRQLKLDQQNLSYFTYQLIVAIKYMHRSGIIHRVRLLVTFSNILYSGK